VAEIFYKESVERDLRKIDKKQRERIQNKIEKELIKQPKGKKLKGEFQGLFSCRVGEYRVIYTKISRGLLILRVGHRKDVYL